jgi:hypothetical protein
MSNCVVVYFSAAKSRPLSGKIWFRNLRMIWRKVHAMCSSTLWLGPMIMPIRVQATSTSWILWEAQRFSKFLVAKFLHLILPLCRSWKFSLPLERIGYLVSIWTHNFLIFLFISANLLFYVDVIGHVVEKDVIKETEKNGKKSKVMDITLEDLE